MRSPVTMLLHEYFDDWIHLYKAGMVRKVTLNKYLNHLRILKTLAPALTLANLDRRAYQQIVSKYAETRATNTVKDFHNSLKAAVLDAVDDGLLEKNPCRKISIGGNQQLKRKEKFLSLHEVEKLLAVLDLETPPKQEVCKQILEFEETSGLIKTYKMNHDWLIYLAIKTGLRYAEILALTPSDFDFASLTVTVNKTMNYKDQSGIEYRTKTRSSVRTIAISQEVADKFQNLLTDFTDDELIFAVEGQRIFNSTPNNRLGVLCKKADITPISIHGLRHTHASLLLYNGVSIHSISRRLGHSKVSITQDVYSHIIDELQQKDDGLIRGVI